jgi:hypothetical protein
MNLSQIYLTCSAAETSSSLVLQITTEVFHFCVNKNFLTTRSFVRIASNFLHFGNFVLGEPVQHVFEEQ